MNEEYVLIYWPNSQEYMTDEYSEDIVMHPTISGAIFVPKALVEQ